MHLYGKMGEWNYSGKKESFESVFPYDPMAAFTLKAKLRH
jgi:hypothetical protein